MAANQTYAEDGASAEAGGVTKPPPMTATLGRTVLPRIERAGEAVRVVHDDKERYETTRTVGVGGMGEVRLAQDHDIGRPVAIKRLHASLKGGAGISRFVSEIRTVGSLEHPNIVPIHDVGVDPDGSYFFVMKYLDGDTVEEIIKRLKHGDVATQRAYPMDRRLKIIGGVLQALEYAHMRGIVHRDVKPANVMVGRFGEVVLMDWGIAKQVGGAEQESLGTGEQPVSATATRMGTMIGTPAYMSPEQFRGEIDKIDARSDVYAVGVMLYELITLKNAAAGEKDVEAVKTLVLGRESVLDRSDPPQPGAGFDLFELARRAAHRDPDQRFASARAMIEEMDLISQGLCRVDCPFTGLKRMTGLSGRFIDKHPFVSMGAAVASVGTLAGGAATILALAAALALA